MQFLFGNGHIVSTLNNLSEVAFHGHVGEFANMDVRMDEMVKMGDGKNYNDRKAWSNCISCSYTPRGTGMYVCMYVCMFK